VARGSGLDRVLLVGVHLEELADALLLALGRVHHLGAGADLARVHAHVGQLAEERVGRHLERQGRERLGRVGLAQEQGLLVTGRVALDRRDVQRRGEVGDDGVEHGLHALVLERRAAQHRVELGGDRQLADRALDLVDAELLATEELLQQLVVALGHGLQELLAVFLRLLLEVLRDLLDRVVLTELRVATPGQRAVLDQVDDADERALRADRQLDDQRLGAEALLDGAHGEEEVRTELVHLVDEADPRDVVLVRLTPDRLRLRLDTLLAVEHGHRAVQHAQRPLDLDREVDVAGRVDDVDLVVLPETGRRGRRDRDAALLLLLHPVHRGRAVVDLADLVVDPGVEQDPLGRRGLAGIDVGHDADVADLGQVGQHVECHSSLPRLVGGIPASAAPFGSGPVDRRRMGGDGAHQR
jgi:hypothetical protein